jgi:hypothetical protein
MLSLCKRGMEKFKNFIVKMWEDLIHNGGIAKFNM